MFERFGESARQVVVLAQDEARALGHVHIGTEHLLLGVMRDAESRAARVLDSLDFTLEEARAQVVLIAGRGSEASPDQLPFTLRAGKVLELASGDAIALGWRKVGSEHILLALLRVEEGVAFRVLEALGVVVEEVRALALAPDVRSDAGQPPRLAGPRAEPPATQLPFDPETWKVLALAQDEARALRHNSIGPEHLLLGLLNDPASIAGRVLAFLEVTPEEVRAEAVALFERVEQLGDGQIPFTPRARRALDLAQREARGLRCRTVAPEHVLLGLVRENEGMAVAERVRREIVRLLAAS